MTAYLLSFVAGVVTVLNPCVLPLLPIVLASALQENRWGPVAFAGGLVVSFALAGTAVTALSFGLGFDTGIVRTLAGAAMAAAGLLLVSAPAMSAFSRVVAPVAGGAAVLTQRVSGAGLQGQAGLGAILGVVWVPCTGPTLGAALALAAQAEELARSISLMLVFGLGVSVPLLALAYGSRTALAVRRDGLRRAAAWARPVLGWAVLAVGVLILTGLDRRIESWLLDYAPPGLVRFTTAF